MKVTPTGRRSAATRDPRWRFRLYVNDMTPRSRLAVGNLRRLCDEALPLECAVEIVDVHSYPELAKTLNIVALPMLVRMSPKPMRVAIGDLSTSLKLPGGPAVERLDSARKKGRQP